MSSAPRDPRNAFSKAVSWALPGCFLLFAAYYAATTANVLSQFALREPTFDQYKEYARYLSQPFLTSVFMLENGHRPVFPALIANIEIATMSANQLLQLGIGSLCVVLSVSIIAITAWRHVMPRAARAAAVMLAVLGLLWLANARMLVQGVGQLQIYLVVVSVLIAALASWMAYRDGSRSAMLTATVACIVAMFTFGAGAAAFPSIIALGLWLRLPLRRLAIPVCAWLICLVLYLVVLPGHEGVQHSLALRPLDSALAAARWLSSPWANAFFGLADPPLQPWLQHSVSISMVRSANAVVGTTGIRWPSISTFFGVLGIVVFLARIAWRYVHRAEPSRYETLATALCLFGLFTAAVIGLGRLDYFDAFPNQEFADRYLAWPCLFWTGLMLLLIDDACRSGKRSAIGAMLACCFALPFLLFPTHHAWSGWTTLVYRGAERAAAAARSDVFDAEVYPDADATREDVLQSLAAFKAQRLAMFAAPGWELLGMPTTTATPRADIVMDAHIVAKFDDAVSHLPAARVEGVVRDGLDRLRDCQLAVVDDDGRVAGIAQFSFIDRDAGLLRLRHRPKRGFDAYIRDYRPDRVYRIAAIQKTSRELLAQAPIAPAL
jgi:hypothetical protein